MRVYLDNNATTMLLPEVREAVINTLESESGNPSSEHTLGRSGRRLVERARSLLLQKLDFPESNGIFTGSGTEANAIAIGSALEGHTSLACTSAVEHSSVVEAFLPSSRWHHKVQLLAVDSSGRVDLADLEKILKAGASFVAIQAANSETGVRQPLNEIVVLCDHYDAAFHCDATQFIGRVNDRLAATKKFSATLSGHKLHAPKGIGFLCYSAGLELDPIYYGGGQEFGLRSGTENTAGIAGLRAAIEARFHKLQESIFELRDLRDFFEGRITDSLDLVRVNGGDTDRVPNTSNLRFAGIDGAALVARLDREGIYCSQTSACTSGRPEPSYVLRAMGLSEEEAYSSVRFSFSVLNTRDEVEYAVEKIIRLVNELRGFRRRMIVGGFSSNGVKE